MSKSVLVIDTPENCYDCPFGTEYCSDSEYEGCCELAECLDGDTRLIAEEHYDYESESRPAWCLLKPLPEKGTIENDMTDYQCGMVDGRNQCIDEITGKVE